MLFQIASDIHIEKRYPDKVGINDFIIPNCDNLILAGDIGSIYHYDNFVYFLQSCKEFFKNVILVPGNNEYYSRDGFQMKTMEELNIDLEKICNTTGTYLLNNSFIEFENLIIFGTTWWSHIPDTLRNRLLRSRILVENGRPFNVDDFNYLHVVARKCLNKMLEIKGDKKLVVVTHYCPTTKGTMSSSHKREEFIDLLPYYFSSSEKYLTGQIDTWIYGHTHVFRDFRFNGIGTRIISNADPTKKFFKKTFLIDI